MKSLFTVLILSVLVGGMRYKFRLWPVGLKELWLGYPASFLYEVTTMSICGRDPFVELCFYSGALSG